MRVSAQPLLYAHERRLSTWNAPVGTHTCPKAALTALLNSSASFLERNFAAKLAACGAPPDKVAVTLKAIFADADRQHTGSLPLEGVIDAIQALKAKCPLSKAALDAHTAVRHFEMADANGDGVISFEEWRTYVTENILAHTYGLREAAAAAARRSGSEEAGSNLTAGLHTSRLSQNELIERRVAELVPGIADMGVHRNRLLLFGGAAPSQSSSESILMRSNDYLNLSGHPTITAARAEAMLHEAPPASSAASSKTGHGEEARPRIFSVADIDRHRALELRLASLLQAEDAALTMSGAHAVAGLLRTLRGPLLSRSGTPIYADRLSWSNASLRHELGITPFAHNDMHALQALAADEKGIIVVDALYGNGAVGELAHAARIAEETGSVLVVDETHAFGCAAGGLGFVDELGLADKVHFRTVGFSKAMAARGGAIIGPSRALEAFRFNDATMIFSTAPKTHEAIGWDATLDVLLSEDGEARRRALKRNYSTLRAGMLDLGMGRHVGTSDRQILVVETGDAATTQAFRDACAASGLFGAIFCPPFAQEGKTFVRFTVNSGLKESQLERFLETMNEAKRKGLLPP